MAAIQRHFGLRENGADQFAILGKVPDVLTAIVGDDKSDDWTLLSVEAGVGGNQSTAWFECLDHRR